MPSLRVTHVNLSILMCILDNDCMDCISKARDLSLLTFSAGVKPVVPNPV
jgi:hypothetical protein